MTHTARNEWHRFRECSDDPDEVFATLASIIGGSSTPDERVARLGSPPQIEVGYSKKRNPFVRATGPEPDWPALVDGVIDVLASEECWTTFAMSGYFRDVGVTETKWLQVRPVDDLRAAMSGEPWRDGQVPAPGPPSLNALLVDVVYSKPRNWLIATQRRDQAVAEAANLLTVATWPKVLLPAGPLQWTSIFDPVSVTTRNFRTTPSFYHPDLGDRTLKPVVGTSSLETMIEHSRFVTGPLDDLREGALHVVDTLAELHSGLRNMPHAERRATNRALAWMADAANARNTSVRIACYVAGLEALLPQSPGSACSTCKQDSYRINSQVKELLDEYAGTAMRKEYLDTVYNLRSRLVHGKWHYKVDAPTFSVTRVKFVDEIKVETAARAAMLNWLLAHGQDSSIPGVGPPTSHHTPR